MRRAVLLCIPLVLAIAGCGGSGSEASTETADRPTSPPAASEPGAAYTVAPDGPATSDASFKRCLSLTGVQWRQPFVAAPAVFRVTAGGGAAIEAFDACMKAARGYLAIPIADAEASFIEQCTGDQKQYVVPFYIGMTEQEALEAQPPTTGPVPVRSAQVTARDGDCLAAAADLRPDRADLVVQNGQVIWAGVPDQTATGGTTGRG